MLLLLPCELPLPRRLELLREGERGEGAEDKDEAAAVHEGVERGGPVPGGGLAHESVELVEEDARGDGYEDADE